MNLDVLAAPLCAWMGFCLGVLHIVSDPKMKPWMPIPDYVRWCFFAGAMVFLWRSVNLVTNGSPDKGHVNVEGFVLSIVLTCLFTALAYWIGGRVLVDHGWERVTWTEGFIRRRPDHAPVMMTQGAMAAAILAKGGEAVGPDAPPQDLLH